MEALCPRARVRPAWLAPLRLAVRVAAIYLAPLSFISKRKAVSFLGDRKNIEHFFHFFFALSRIGKVTGGGGTRRSRQLPPAPPSPPPCVHLSRLAGKRVLVAIRPLLLEHALQQQRVRYISDLAFV